MRPLLAAFVALSLLTTLPAARAQVIDYRSSDDAMNAAMGKARGTLPVFDEAFRAKSAERYSVKVAIPASGGGNEHIWMDVTGIEGGDYRGRIANKPVRIPKMQRGDSYRAKADKISDWAYVQGGKMHGHYTTRVMLKDLPPEQAREFEGRMAPLP